MDSHRNVRFICVVSLVILSETLGIMVELISIIDWRFDQKNTPQ
jgi:hypothetical protein